MTALLMANLVLVRDLKRAKLSSAVDDEGKTNFRSFLSWSRPIDGEVTNASMLRFPTWKILDLRLEHDD